MGIRVFGMTAAQRTVNGYRHGIPYHSVFPLAVLMGEAAALPLVKHPFTCLQRHT